MKHAAEPDEEPLAPPPAPPPARSPWRWATAGLAVVAVAASGVAVWALMRPTADDSAAPTAQQVTEAKGKACEAYAKVRTAVALQTQAQPGDDPVAAQAVAANARLAMAVGSQHLVDNLSPAVPADLAGLLRTLATDLQDLTIDALAGTADGGAGQEGRMKALETNSAKIVELCK
ncbi:hypothetical protein CIW49_01980 [Mycolicibacterium sp. P1-18]|uniref:hypothetical protein n=1 Tax=Mycolicibacterium sp. P1-18 TaxID=2024615 RepID=UPI0011F0AD49|nr:hypothetical protein [Mycolicibacterium sp. P1-18]KAA0102124.1 hypothetical protein CIW49_01980 [Mycolicibacterium sp. P1-18]